MTKRWGGCLLFSCLGLGTISSQVFALPPLEPVFVIKLQDTAKPAASSVWIDFDSQGRAVTSGGQISHFFSSPLRAVDVHSSTSLGDSVGVLTSAGPGLAGSTRFNGKNMAAYWDNPIVAPQQIYFSGITSKVISGNSSGVVLIQELSTLNVWVYKTKKISDPSTVAPETVTSPTPPAGLTWTQMNPKAVGPQGEVIGTMVASDQTVYPFRWAKTQGAELLPGLPQSPRQGEALGVGGDGTVVGTLTDKSGRMVPVLWQNGSQSPQTLFSNSFTGRAVSAKSKDQIVGWFEPTPGTRAGFYYYEGQAYNLNNLGTMQGAPFKIVEALDISVSGVVALKTVAPNGQNQIALMIQGETPNGTVTPYDAQSGTQDAKLKLSISRFYGTPLEFSVSGHSDGGRVRESGFSLIIFGSSGDSSKTFDVPIEAYLGKAGSHDRAFLRVMPRNTFWPDAMRMSNLVPLNILPVPLKVEMKDPTGWYSQYHHLRNGGDVHFHASVDRTKGNFLERLFKSNDANPQAIAKVKFVAQPDVMKVSYNTGGNLLLLTANLLDESNKFVVVKSRGVSKDTKVKIQAVEANSGVVLAESELNLQGPRVGDSRDDNAKFNTTSDFTVQLNSPAPPGGLKLKVSADDWNMLQVPSTITIDEGETKKTVKVKSGIGLIPADHNVKVTVEGPENTNVTTIKVKLL